mmetsp:Transcript_2624/g.4087  ORF Transcript_2624/g.4087 Transcript_2624/m.4087 type:complete len:247 (-) Transcript_2624:3288-4028(-)
MPTTRNERRLAATKRTIMGELQDVDPADENINSSHGGVVSKDLDGANPDQVRLLLEDLGHHLKQKQEIITADMETGKQEQQQVYFSGMMKLKKDVKKMTVRDFNSQNNCDLLQMLKEVASCAAMGKKRTHMDMETPAPAKGRKKALMTPGTRSRTARKGEQVFSKNYSPLQATDEGALIATVTKKRKGNSRTSGVDFAINVGDGRQINLGDPRSMKHLDDDMKTSAVVQLKVLQDQMASLMAQLTN